MDELNFELFDLNSFIGFMFRFSLNILVILIIVRYIYYRAARRKDYLFTYILISTTVFLLTFLLRNVAIELGFALGLFAIFGILRYRTSQIPIKEMTYLFVVIAISIINALSNEQISLTLLLLTNLILILVTRAGEYFWMFKHASSKTIIYDKLELLRPENERLLIKDIEERMGVKIKRIEVGQVNFLKSLVELTIYYFDDSKTPEFYSNKEIDS